MLANVTIVERVAVGQKLAQHMSTLLMATSWTHAVNDDEGEYSYDRAEMGAFRTVGIRQ